MAEDVILASETPIHIEKDDQQGEIPFWKVVFYGLGNAAGLLLYNTFNTFIQFFYTDSVGLPSQWVGRGWFAFGFWNAVNDPVAGWLSDRTQSAMGRRTFYIRLIAIPVAIAFALVWLPPLSVDEHGTIAVLAYFLIIISIYDILQTIITLNQDALFPEMFPDRKSRSRAASIRQMVGLGFGGGIAIALSPLIYESSLGWAGLAAMWSTLAVIFYFMSLLGIQENPAYAMQSQESELSILKGFRLAIENRTFLTVIGINLIIRFILAITAASLPFYAKYVLRLSGGETSLLTSALIVTAVVSMVIWQVVFHRIGTRRTMIYSFALAAVFALPILFTQTLAGTLVTLIGLGATVGGTFLAPDLIFAEMIDEDYVETGVRREGLYRGLLGFTFRFPPAFAGLIIGELLAAAGYDADLSVSEQPEAVETVIRYFTAVSPFFALLVGLFLVWRYPLHGQYLDNIQDRAAELRGAAKRKTSELKPINPDSTDDDSGAL
ncbi:MAG: MFS transporter [Chloroflexi bacterium]|nr:MFS transporter [Chloroflexota bacterium]